MAYKQFLCASFYILLPVYGILLEEYAPASLSIPIDSANVTVTASQWHPHNLSAANGILVECNPKSTYSSAVVEDCRVAKEYLLTGKQTLTWRDREIGSVANFVNLPYRVMGGSLTAPSRLIVMGLTETAEKGLCYFQPKLMPQAKLAKASLNDVGIAATALFTKCALGKSSGGVASSIGIGVLASCTQRAFAPDD